jgi:hypothetical protein
MASWLVRYHDVLFAGQRACNRAALKSFFSTPESGELHALFSASTRIFTVTPDPHALFV